MKTFCITGLIVLMMLEHARSQSKETADQFSMMSPEDARKAISDPKQFPNLTHRQLVEAAIKTRSFDLVKVCFQTRETWRPVYDIASEMPESTFKEQVQIMMLRESPDFWGPDPGSVPIARFRMYGEAIERFSPLVKKYLPNTPLTQEMLEWKATRAKLADDLEKAMAAAGVPPQGKNSADQMRPADTKRDDSTPKTPSPTRSEASVTSAPTGPSKAQSATEVDSSRSLIPWIIGGGLAAVLLFFAARRVLRL